MRPPSFRESALVAALKDITCHSIAPMNIRGCFRRCLLALRAPNRMKRVKNILHNGHFQAIAAETVP
jgi:hypothetical protein